MVRVGARRATAKNTRFIVWAVWALVKRKPMADRVLVHSVMCSALLTTALARSALLALLLLTLSAPVVLDSTTYPVS